MNINTDVQMDEWMDRKTVSCLVPQFKQFIMIK